MIQLIYSPNWFFGKDIIFDSVSIFVLLLISFFSFRYYRLNKENKKHLFLSISFLLMALSFLFKIVMNFTIYYTTIETEYVGKLAFTYSELVHSDLLFWLGFLAYRLLMLGGLYILYLLYTKQDKSTIFLTSYLIVVLTYCIDDAYYIFHLTSLILLIFITTRYYFNYKETKHSTNKWLFYSFALVALSSLIFVFIEVHNMFYVIAEFVQLLGYVVLLITLIKVLGYGKKKGKK